VTERWVGQKCLAFALRTRQPHGIWGGMTEEERASIRRRGPQLTVDLRGVTFMECAGLTMLLATRRRAQLAGGWVRLVEVPPQARRMISLLHLDRAFGLGALGRPAGIAAHVTFVAQ
jgi:ABC-type transporter Mla MlaB component